MFVTGFVVVVGFGVVAGAVGLRAGHFFQKSSVPRPLAAIALSQIALAALACSLVLASVIAPWSLRQV